jgi:hypothetical protein
MDRLEAVLKETDGQVLHTGYPGINVSGKTSRLIFSAAACSMRHMTFLIVAALSIKTGAAWAAATRNLVDFGTIPKMMKRGEVVLVVLTSLGSQCLYL